MEFEWDEKKNLENIKQHGISFKRAVKIFNGHVLEWIDDRRDYGEERIIALGRSERTILSVVYTMRVIRLPPFIPPTRGDKGGLQGGQQKMKEENILRYTLEELEKIPDETDWERVSMMKDEEVEALAKEDPDAQPLTEEELNKFKRTLYVKGEKVWEDSKTIGELLEGAREDFAVIPVSKDLLDWFMKKSEDYLAHINSVLRDYVEANR